MAIPRRRRPPRPDHRCTFQDALTGDPVAELIAPAEWPQGGPHRAMHRGRWYRCRQDCGTFIFVPPRGAVFRLYLWPGATLEQAQGRLARWRDSFES